MRLYEIGQEYEALYSLCENIEIDETGEVVDNSKELEELYQGLGVALANKLENSAYICKDLNSSAKALKEEAKRLQAKAKSFENNENKIRELMKLAILESGQLSHKTDKFSFSVGNKESYKYDNVDEFILEDNFFRIKRELDKKKITEFVQAGGVIKGLEVENINILKVR